MVQKWAHTVIPTLHWRPSNLAEIDNDVLRKEAGFHHGFEIGSPLKIRRKFGRVIRCIAQRNVAIRRIFDLRNKYCESVRLLGEMRRLILPGFVAKLNRKHNELAEFGAYFVPGTLFTNFKSLQAYCLKIAITILSFYSV
jgi:hypothetical protein